MNKKLLAVLLIAFTLLLAACGKSDDGVIKVGTTTSEAPTWNLVKDLAKEEGIELEVIKIDDYVKPNIALDEGEIDINAFQTVVYFDNFIKERDLDLSAIGTTNIWPMGIYSKKVDNINDLKDGDQIIIPNDPTNLGRALLLLQKAELIKLKDDFDGTGGVENIVENPKNFEITPVAAGQTARGLDDAAASVINSDMAINAGLNPTKESIFREDSSNKAYINIIAAKTDRKDDEDFAKIVEIYHSEEVSSFIEEHFNGEAVPVKEPVSFLEDYKQN